MPASWRRRLVLLVDSDPVGNRNLVALLRQSGVSARGVLRIRDAEEVIREEEPVVILLDCRLGNRSEIDALKNLLPICPILLLTERGETEGALRPDFREAQFGTIEKPVHAGVLVPLVHRAMEWHWLRWQAGPAGLLERGRIFWPMVGTSPAFQTLLRQIEAMARMDYPVVITGEQGSGKRSAAEAIHRASARRHGHFVVLDPRIVPQDKLDEDLFGVELRAGRAQAYRQPGRLELAEGGTLFIRDLPSLPEQTQARLIRMFKRGTYCRIGGTSELRADVRLIAGVRSEIGQGLVAGRLRRELQDYFGHHAMVVPPLRMRENDSLDIAHHCLHPPGARLKDEFQLEPAAREMIRGYAWPGNIRELRGVMRRARMLAGRMGLISAEMLALLPTRARTQEEGICFDFDTLPTINDLQVHYIEELLRRDGFSRARIAQTLAISERTVYRILQSRRH